VAGEIVLTESLGEWSFLFHGCFSHCISHPHSIDALCSLPSSYPSSHSTILTGSSDGLLRAVQLLPTKLIGVIADHGDFPIERIAVDLGGEGRWVGSAGHEEVLRLTDLKEVFEDESEKDVEDQESDEEEEGAIGGVKSVRNEMSGEEQEETSEGKDNDDLGVADDEGRDGSDGEASDVPQQKRKRKKEKDPLAGRKKKGRNQVDAEPSFFSEL
jgi:WD repeat-containing protein 55